MDKDPAAYSVGNWVRFKEHSSGEATLGIINKKGGQRINPRTFEHEFIMSVRCCDNRMLLISEKRHHAYAGR